MSVLSISDAKDKIKGFPKIDLIHLPTPLQKLKNLSNKIAFFTELTLKDNNGSAILPVFWEDNYVSLLPGEERDILGYVSRKDYTGESISLGVQFWNME